MWKQSVLETLLCAGQCTRNVYHMCGSMDHTEDIKCWEQAKRKEPGAGGLQSMTSEHSGSAARGGVFRRKTQRPEDLRVHGDWSWMWSKHRRE